MKRFLACVSALTLVLAGAGQARADLVEVTSRSALAGTDFVDWGKLGPNGTSIPNPFSINSNGGVKLTVSQAGASTFTRLDQGAGWNGNFAPGAHLLWTTGANGPVTMSYGITNGVSAIGAQIQANFFGAFTATITAYDASNTVIGSFTENGVSNSNGDNSAIFLGVLSHTTSIFRIQYSVSSSVPQGQQDFGINQLDFTKSNLSSTPEPASLTMLGIGIVGMAGYVLRRRKKAEPAAC